jgi:hypothetical protein
MTVLNSLMPINQNAIACDVHVYDTVYNVEHLIVHRKSSTLRTW